MPNKIATNSMLPNIEFSDALWERGRHLIPAGTQTLAKGPSQHSNGVAPKYLLRGRGARVWDVDGNEYLDLEMGIGPLILGYCDPVVDAAIREQLTDGICFSLMHPLEVEVAELMRECIPNADCVRFAKTGADVTSAAVRLARAYTGRERVVCCGYHGWHDWHIAVTNRHLGVPESTRALTSSFDYGDIESLLRVLDDETACVILEPLTFQDVDPQFFTELRRQCDAYGALLIFDEMWTGFRCHLGGAQAYLNVRADLAVFSKAMANGMPISALTGHQEVMCLLESDVFFFTTFGGETLSLAAALACISFMRDHAVVEHIARLGCQLAEGLTDLISDRGLETIVRVAGRPYRTCLNFYSPDGQPLVLKTYVQQELLRHGILWSGIHNLCYSHTSDDIEYLLAAYASVFDGLRAALATGTVKSALRGELLQAVFRNAAQVSPSAKAQRYRTETAA
jgi:glutamate-1-semialdehyde 2,1-aminomutase